MRRVNKNLTLITPGDLLSEEEYRTNVYFQICNFIDIRICINKTTFVIDKNSFQIVTDTNNKKLIDDGLKCLYNVDKT